MKKKGKIFYTLLGVLTGFANGLFGSGGGMIAVPMLEKTNIDQKQSHATSLALTLPLSVVSAVFYAFKGAFDFKDALPLIPFGLVGAIIGSLLLKRIHAKPLKILFGVFLIIAGGRMILK